MVDITSDCTLGTENRTICMATLQMDYENNRLSLIFDGLSQDSWNVSEGTRIITHNMEISLNTPKLKRIIQVYCFDNNSCVQDIRRIITSISFPQVHPSRIISLRGDLQSKLYNSSNSNDLLCENNQNETIPCPNGFCQLTDNGEFGYTRNCIPKDSATFSPSILIGSSMVNEFEKRSPFMYICNQRMCNNLSMAQEIRRTLADYGLLIPFFEQPIFGIITTTVKSKSLIIRMLPQSMIGIQYILFILMTTFFR
ncbi:unnamed protein product [Adineta steineri]|uniref:Uncharacterized protein n=1 Tax=Adineta steineri TaxID=433720 RepID=A0A815D8J3_9BILA|nr:unnamed protein product [Adineta steineri]CAF3809281.1 unnamed protein product [Adineta steineri]